MITYEITATVAVHLVPDYERFMIERHMPDLLATGAFAGARLSRSVPGRYRTRYEVHSRQALDKYLGEDAPRLRAHMAEAFPEGVEHTREEWEILASLDETRGRAVQL